MRRQRQDRWTYHDKTSDGEDHNSDELLDTSKQTPTMTKYTQQNVDGTKQH